MGCKCHYKQCFHTKHIQNVKVFTNQEFTVRLLENSDKNLCKQRGGQVLKVSVVRNGIFIF